MSGQQKLAKFFGGSNGAASSSSSAAAASKKNHQTDIRSAFSHNNNEKSQKQQPQGQVPATSTTQDDVEMEQASTTSHPSKRPSSPIRSSNPSDEDVASTSTSQEQQPSIKKRLRIVESDDSDDDDDKPVEKNGKKAPADEDEDDEQQERISAHEPTEAIAAATATDTDTEVEEPDEAGEEEDEEFEQEQIEEEEDKKGAKKLAAIFQKKTSSAAFSTTSPSSLPGEGATAWKQGESVPYSALAATFSAIQATTKRLEITEILTQFLIRVISRSPSDLLQVIYLCINRLCPDYEGLELGIGESLLIKAIAQSTGREVARIKKDLETLGDLGLVALNSKKNQPTMFKTSRLTVKTVFKQLKEIATTSGHKSQDKKIGIIKKMLASCQNEEPKFLIRSLEGKLRIGLAERSVLISLARAVILSRLMESKRLNKMPQDELAGELERGTEIVKSVYSELPSYDLLIPALLENGVENLRSACKLTPGVPLKPMLAKPTKAITEVLDRFEGLGELFTCEYKYDGERAQIHFLADGSLKVFSRNSEDMSVKYPDLVDQIPRCIYHRKASNGTTTNDAEREGASATGLKEVESFVLDAEVTAWKSTVVDPATGSELESGKLLPFQELARRKRKDVKASDIVVKVKLFAFDLLYLNGQSLLQKSFQERRQLLYTHFRVVKDEFDFATSSDCSTVEEIATFLDEAISSGCEGLMVKMLTGDESTYEPSKRSLNWLKLKKDYLTTSSGGIGDSLDLVVLGGYFGKGKRTNVYGAFLLGTYDSDSETYQTICKIGTGFTELDLSSFYSELKPLELTTKKSYYDTHSGMKPPDVWFEPKIVWEVKTADLSISPIYTTAKHLLQGQEAIKGTGISLRFPRFIRKRQDKSSTATTNPEQIYHLFKNQVVSSSDNSKAKTLVDDDDGFW